MELIPITEETLSPVSLKVNGEWLETAIPQLFASEYASKWCYFLTCGVSGRDDDEVSINATDLPGDGATYYGKRRSSRNLSISFYLESDTRENVMLAYEFIGRYFNKLDECQIIFGDDRSRYYMGYYAGMSFSGRGYNGSDVGIVCQVAFFCPDRYKYSVSKKEFNGVYDSEHGVMSLQIQNGGSIPASIDYDVTFNQKSGYIGFVSENGAMQFGDSEQTAKSGSRVLCSMTGEQLLNAINDSSNTKVFDLHNIADSSNDNYYFSGHWHTKDGVFTVDGTDNKYFVIDKNCLSAGKSASTSYYGAGAVIDIRQTDYPVLNYKVEFQPWFETFKDPSQKGLLQVFVVNKPVSGRATVISGIQFKKYDVSNNKAWYYFKVGDNSEKGGHDKFKADWTPDLNSTFIEDGPSVSFSKDGATFSFNCKGTSKSYTDDEYGEGGALENLEATHLVIFIGNEKAYTKWVGRYIIAGDTNSEIPRMRIGNIKMDQTNEASEVFDADNTYKSGDVMLINGTDATVTVNGTNRVSDEKIGTEYFKADPGSNEIQVLFSEFDTNNPPTVKARIREGWL